MVIYYIKLNYIVKNKNGLPIADNPFCMVKNNSLHY